MIVVGAAPHLPAGILSPYRDGERDASLMISPVARRKKGEGIAASYSRPVYGERCATVSGGGDG
ncbi:hypothetical protein EN845_23710 [Mesorhizobium sp. M8A.F.Ca.ET.202.01.1.1]|nr:hypothetical protein EN845_23710 [Mesorhizobium sp. M8A.F.Ca.ET.202.01.1.1]TGR22078.1 hypothetical protein EN840_24920 [Mesorhizobium sp. M8A.F.Ca.ET.197.01.1.1]TGR38717.1 hypothetical protein EN842_44965 [bacterium M00.F.Ca.ET.199.01.1.1]TGR45530.1 hypothetical protein EN841_24915 [Mesorhizobium sp. M8A.F.Ca.ET.198.01.1.1]TGU28181.1 hypothetical protein EN799_38840 [bacterium M00.F.Ca.ET.156.01.1.1]TGV83715.1 hypothetical protein EN792_025295 [Mesorhizobium sp. M00.F.Ca.ET.149.01.1.1]